MGNDKFEFITEMQVWFNIRKTNEYNLLHEQSKGEKSCCHKLGSPKADIQTGFRVLNVYQKSTSMKGRKAGLGRG